MAPCFAGPPGYLAQSLSQDVSHALYACNLLHRKLAIGHLLPDERLRHPIVLGGILTLDVFHLLLDVAFQPNDEVVSRLRNVDTLPLGVALLRQSTVSGIGNVYKSEVCFIQRLDPFAPVSAYRDHELRDVIALAQRLLNKNLRGAHRITTRAGQVPLWVYGRKDEPCGVCESRIDMRRQGEMGRSTYFCRAWQLKSKSA